MAARTLKVFVPDRVEPLFSLADSNMTVEEVRAVVAQTTGNTAVETMEYTETIVSDNGREIKFKRVTGGTKGN